MIVEMNEYSMHSSYEQYGYICVKSYERDIFIRIGPDGCELEKLHIIGNLNVIGIDVS